MNALREALKTTPASEIDTEALYEWVDGERRELQTGVYDMVVASTLLQYLGAYAQAKALGRTVVAMLFDLVPVKSQRRPDVAFVSFARWQEAVPVPRTDAWDVVPDLAVEVVCPDDVVLEILGKIREYFQAGVQLVWLVLPSERLVYVYTSWTQIKILTDADVLDAGEGVPGFQLAVKELFEEEGPPANGTGPG
jgi:Uma2 family endonuclease